MDKLNFTLDEVAIRRVLKDWDSLKALGEHPLADLAIVKARHRAAGYTNTSAGRGLALREILQAALDALKPENGSPDLQQKSWRRYFIVAEQYLHGRSPEWVMEQLHVSKGTYYSEQKRALEMLADILQEQEEAYGGAAASDQLGKIDAVTQVPFLAPPRPAHNLIGRDDLLLELKRRLLNGDNRALVALTGLPGVGKTSLAIELAHAPEILSHFADGVLWAGLGRRPDLPALLGTWAAAMGVSAEAIAARPTVAERAALVHAAIGLRRMLLIIDDAWQAESALALKLGGPNCAHLATSRLINVALDIAGDNMTKVWELDLQQGLELLAQLSPQAVADEPDEAQALVQRVGGLPLALVLMGGYLRKQSHGNQSRRLREALAGLKTTEACLQMSQPQSPLVSRSILPLSLEATIGLNKTALNPRARQAWLDLSLFPSKPNTFSEEAALAVTAVPAPIFDTLVDHGLVESIAPNRYTLHQIIADYAQAKGPSLEAIERMAAYFAHYAETNLGHLEMLDLELNNIIAAFGEACRARLTDPVLRMLKALLCESIVDLRGLYELGIQCARKAYDVMSSGHQEGQAWALSRIGDFKHRQGKFYEARPYLEQSIDLAQKVGDQQTEAYALYTLGLSQSYQGESSQALVFLERALQLFRKLGPESFVGYTLNALGFAYEELCDYSQAERYLKEALQFCRAGGNRRGEAWAHLNLCMTYLPLGQFDRAGSHIEQALSIYQETEDRRGKGWAIYNLGRYFRQVGDYNRSRASFEQAITLFSEIGDRMGHGLAVHNLGLTHGELGDPATAKTHFEQALNIFRQSCYWAGVKHCNNTLGKFYRRQGNYTAAKFYFDRPPPPLAGNDQRGESKRLVNLGLIYFHLGNHQKARSYGGQGVEIAQKISARPTLADNLTRFGQILMGLGCLDEAAAAYQRALALRQDMGQAHLATEPLAGLAEVCLARGDLSQAMVLVGEILAYLDTNTPPNGNGHGLAGTDNPGQIYQTCYRVLQASHDPRANAFSGSGKVLTDALDVDPFPKKPAG